MTLTAFAAERRHLQNDVHSKPTVIDRYLMPTGCSAAKMPAIAAVIDGTDKRMDTHPLHRPCSIYYAGSVNNATIQRTLDICITSQHPDTMDVKPAGFCHFCAASTDADR